jgi:hypothetical protein
MIALRFIAWCLVHIYEAACWLCLALWIASLFMDRFGHTTRRDD